MMASARLPGSQSPPMPCLARKSRRREFAGGRQAIESLAGVPEGVALIGGHLGRHDMRAVPCHWN